MIFFVVQGTDVFSTEEMAPNLIVEAQTRNTESVGNLLYSTYLLPFEIASALVLVAMVGAVVSTAKER